MASLKNFKGPQRPASTNQKAKKRKKQIQKDPKPNYRVGNFRFQRFQISERDSIERKMLSKYNFEISFSLENRKF